MAFFDGVEFGGVGGGFFEGGAGEVGDQVGSDFDVRGGVDRVEDVLAVEMRMLANLLQNSTIFSSLN